MVYLSTIRRWCCQKKFSNDKVSLNEVICFTSFDKYSSFMSQDILKCHYFLENITGQKPHISQSKSGYVGSTKYYSVTNKVTLRKFSMYNFLEYLRCTAIPTNVRLQGFIEKVKISNGIFGYSFINWSLFYGQEIVNLDTEIVLRLLFKGNSFCLVDLLRLYKVV